MEICCNLATLRLTRKDLHLNHFIPRLIATLLTFSLQLKSRREFVVSALELPHSQQDNLNSSKADGRTSLEPG